MDNVTSARRYSIGGMIFHWVIAVAVVVNWRLAENAHHAQSPASGSRKMRITRNRLRIVQPSSPIIRRWVS